METKTAKGTMRDFFDKRTDKERLWDWLKNQPYAKTSDILRWGADNYSNRAERNARELFKEGKLKRMPAEQKILYFGKIKEEVWIITP